MQLGKRIAVCRLNAIKLACCSVFLLALTSVAEAQPVSFATPDAIGGQLVQEMVPYQPEAIFVQPGPEQTPIYLDQSLEFQSTIQPSSTDFANAPILVQPNTAPAPSKLPPGVRKGLFQRIFFTGGYVPQFENDSLGFSDLEAGVVLGIPFIRFNTPLLITPRFAVHYLERPNSPDLPTKVYDAEITFRHIRKFGEGPWSMMAAVTTGEYSDFKKSSPDAFRVTGQAFAIYESSPATKWIVGVVYLNRKDIKIVPAVGLIYEPNPDIKYEAVLPRPRISWRLPGNTMGSEVSRWAYIGGEFGGGVWSIQRPATSTPDLLDYNEFRLLVGIEKKAGLGAISHRIEAGYVFGRELEFESGTPDVQLDDSLFVRAGLTY